MRPGGSRMVAGLIAALLVAGGCESGPRGGSAGTLPHCVVCEYNADLACLRVSVTDDTPRAEHNGTTYYFCSEECRAAFVKRPEKYAPVHGGTPVR